MKPQTPQRTRGFLLKMASGKGSMMQEQAAPLYSPKVLEALNELLQNHQALLWVDPTTNSLAVKHITQPLQEDEDQ